MSGDDDEKGLSGARTRADPGAPGAGAIDLDAAAVQLLAQLGASDGEQLDLIDGTPDVESLDPISMTANLVAKRRRGPGRPKGARNRRSSELFDYLASLGHRDPLVTLSMIQTANTNALASVLGGDPVKVLAIQKDAAAKLAEFGYAKQVKLETENKHLHVFVSGVGSGPEARGDAGGLSICGDAEKANEINGSAVRLDSGESHDDTEVQQDQSDSGD